MPIYEYRRPDGTTFEIVQAFSDDPLTVDPETGVPVERVLHPPAVHFKGTGFYNTDYGTRKRNRETAAAGEGSSSEKDSSAGSAGAETAGKESAKPAREAGSASGAGSSESSSDAAKAPKPEGKGSASSAARRGRAR